MHSITKCHSRDWSRKCVCCAYKKLSPKLIDPAELSPKLRNPFSNRPFYKLEPRVYLSKRNSVTTFMQNLQRGSKIQVAPLINVNFSKFSPPLLQHPCMLFLIAKWAFTHKKLSLRRSHGVSWLTFTKIWKIYQTLLPNITYCMWSILLCSSKQYFLPHYLKSLFLTGQILFVSA